MVPDGIIRQYLNLYLSHGIFSYLYSSIKVNDNLFYELFLLLLLVCTKLVQRWCNITDASVDGDGDILPSNPVPFRLAEDSNSLQSTQETTAQPFCFGYDPTLMIWLAFTVICTG